MSEEILINVDLTVEEIRYLVSCGIALAQNIPTKSLPTYCTFNIDQIIEFSKKMRSVMDEHGLDM